jgi:hypothetical protein
LLDIVAMLAVCERLGFALDHCPEDRLVRAGIDL